MPSSALSHPALHSFPTRRSSDLQPRMGNRSQRRTGSPVQPGTASESASAPRSNGSPGPARRSPPGRPASPCSRTLRAARRDAGDRRSEEHTSELQSLRHLVCRLLPSPTQLYTLSLHDALPICSLEWEIGRSAGQDRPFNREQRPNPLQRLVVTARPDQLVDRRQAVQHLLVLAHCEQRGVMPAIEDRKSTRLNSSHLGISYAVFCPLPPSSTLFPYTTLFRSAASNGKSVAAPDRIARSTGNSVRIRFSAS